MTPEQSFAQVLNNLQSGKPMFSGVFPDPEPMLEYYGDRATWEADHIAWKERQGDNLAADTDECCCGDS